MVPAVLRALLLGGDVGYHDIDNPNKTTTLAEKNHMSIYAK